MTAYVISEVEMLDETQGQRYRDLASASIARHGGRYIVRAAVPHVPEGTWPAGQCVVVVEFDSMRRLRRWYDSPEYAKALVARRTALRRRLLFVDGTDGQATYSIEQLERAFGAVGELVVGVGPDQWSVPTPCTDWTARQLVDHLVAVNRVFLAVLADRTPPPRVADHLGDDAVGAYRDSSAALVAAFGKPGVLDRTFDGPLGTATGADRMWIRIYDLLAHGWDLARATGQRVALPDDLAEQALAFARTQLVDQAREGRFAPARPIGGGAPAIERLVAFLGREVGADR